MATIGVYDRTRKRALITRDSARALAQFLREQAAGDREITLDFADVEAVTPSFVDEILTILQEFLGEAGKADLKIMFVNTPTRLSKKFAAVGRAHGLRITESPDGLWDISSERDSPPA